MSKFLNKLWHRIKIRGVNITFSFARNVFHSFFQVGMLWHRMKAGGEPIGVMFLVPGLGILIAMFVLALAGVQLEFVLFTTLLSLGLGLTSVGLGFTSLGMSAQSDKRQTELLERLDKNVAGLPLLFKGDILTPSGHKAVKESARRQSKEAAQRRLDKDTRKAGYVRGKLFQNKDGSWSINWKIPL